MTTTFQYSITDDFPNGFSPTKFASEIGADEIIVTSMSGLTTTGDVVTAEFVDDLQAAEETQLAVLVSDHVGETLQDVKDARIEELRIDVQMFVLSRYPIHNQTSYLGLLLDATVLQNPPLANRAAFIAQGLIWMNTVIGWFYAERDAIQALTTKDDVNAFQWSFAGLEASDPEITLEGAVSILD